MLSFVLFIHSLFISTLIDRYRSITSNLEINKIEDMIDIVIDVPLNKFVVVVQILNIRNVIAGIVLR